MDNLPKERVTGYTRPFTISGVEFAESLFIKKSRHKDQNRISKAYIALFIYFQTQAVHLELITDLITKAFMAALRRFCLREEKEYALACFQIMALIL